MTGPVTDPTPTGRTPEGVDTWLATVLADDPDVTAAQARADAAGLPRIQVSPTQGALLRLLARTAGARRALEVGTLGGVSAIWLARGLTGPGAHLTTLEIDAHHAQVAREAVAAAGLAHVVSVHLGDARALLAELVAAGTEPYDLVFIDADKPSNVAYLEAALQLTRPGAVVVVDNVVRGGALADLTDATPAVVGSRAVVQAAAADPRLEVTVVQTVGEKGHDGMLVARVRDLA